MYQISCDGHLIYDPRDEDLILLNPKCNLGANSVGEGSFTILSNHPKYKDLKRLKSIFEIRQDSDVIFRGRMTNDSKDFHNKMDVDLEGVLGFTNDTVIPPFEFPDGDPPTVGTVEEFLGWVLSIHNEQAEEWQQLKLGNVTVTDPNYYIERSSEKYTSTWEILKTRLFESSWGGYLVIRYEPDGNYVDYLKDFEDTASQQITFGENLLDITHTMDANETYSAILPLGKEMQVETGSDYEGDYVEIKNTVNGNISLESIENGKRLPDGDLTEDLVKKGLFVYSKSAVEQYGWICAPVDSTTWDDITTVNGLKNKAIKYLSETAMKLSDTIEITALDLSFTDDQIQSFRIYQNVIINSPVHGISNVSYPLTKLEIDIVNPQNTKITLGETRRVLTDKENQLSQKIDQTQQSNTQTSQDISKIKIDLDNKVGKDEKDQVVSMVNQADAIIELIGKRLRIDAGNFVLTEEGEMTTKAGFIGEWSINGNGISKDFEVGDDTYTVGIYAGLYNNDIAASTTLYIAKNGEPQMCIRPNGVMEIFGDAKHTKLSGGRIEHSGSGGTTTIDNGYINVRSGLFDGGESMWLQKHGITLFNSDGYSCGEVKSGDKLTISSNRGMNLGKYGTVNSFQGTWNNADGDPVTTSDANKKNSIENLDERYNLFFDALLSKRFKYNSGTSDRYHSGFVAQDVAAALESAGIDQSEFAGIVTFDSGKETETMGLRYSEFISLCVEQIQKLKKRISILEQTHEKG